MTKFVISGAVVDVADSSTIYNRNNNRQIPICTISIAQNHKSKIGYYERYFVVQYYGNYNIEKIKSMGDLLGKQVVVSGKLSGNKEKNGTAITLVGKTLMIIDDLVRAVGSV